MTKLDIIQPHIQTIVDDVDAFKLDDQLQLIALLQQQALRRALYDLKTYVRQSYRSATGVRLNYDCEDRQRGRVSAILGIDSKNNGSGTAYGATEHVGYEGLALILNSEEGGFPVRYIEDYGIIVEFGEYEDTISIGKEYFRYGA